MIALLKYGSGVPFNRLERLEEQLGIPLPAATQWELMEAAAEADQTGAGRVDPAGGARRSAAQRRHQHADSAPGARAVATSARACSPAASYRITARMEDRAVLHRPQARGREPCRCAEAARAGTGCADPDVRCAVAQHAETIDGVETLLANCLAHGRRQFVEVAQTSPKNAGMCWRRWAAFISLRCRRAQRNLSPRSGCSFIRQHSGPVMEELHSGWKRSWRRTKRNRTPGWAKRSPIY